MIRSSPRPSPRALGCATRAAPCQTGHPQSEWVARSERSDGRGLPQHAHRRQNLSLEKEETDGATEMPKEPILSRAWPGGPAGRWHVTHGDVFCARQRSATANAWCAPAYPSLFSSNSTAALLVHVENAEKNRFLGTMPFEKVFILVPVLRHIVDSQA